MTEDIFNLYFILDQKIFVPGHQIQKDPYLMPTIFLSLFFHLLTHTNPAILMDATQLTLTLILLRLFVPCIFDDSVHCAI